MPRGFFIFAFSSLLVFFSAHASAQTRKKPNKAATAQPPKAGLNISADNISRDYDTHTFFLNGHVQIHYKGSNLQCDQATVSTITHQVKAKGHIQLTNPKAFIEGDAIDYNYKNKTGQITNGSVESGNILLLGDKIQKNSETDYDAFNARFTSCVTCPPAWSFSGSEINARLGGYADIKYPILRIADFPILALPRLIVPLKTERQSGFLMPTLSFSSVGGTQTSIPYFWAISKNQDATVTLSNYSKLGVKENLEYRYKLSKDSSGQLEFGHIRDQGFSDSYRAGGSPTGLQVPYTKTMDRGFLTYDHIFNMPDNFVNRVDLDLASDARYPRDYYMDMPVLGEPALENDVSLTKNTERQNMSIETAYYQNLLEPDATSNNQDAVQRFPEISYSSVDTEIGHTNAFFKFDFDYTNFTSTGYSYDTAYLDPSTGLRTIPTYRCDPAVSNCDSFDPGIDQIRTGQRMIIKPTVSYPFHVGNFLDVDPSLTYGDMEYRFDPTPSTTSVADYSQNAARRYLEGTISAKTIYSAVYGPSDGMSPRYKHEIVPEVIYTDIPWQQNPNNVFFGNFQNEPIWRANVPIANNDFTGSSGVQFDYLDRFFNENYTTFVLSNYLTRKTYVKAPDGTMQANYFKFMTFRVSDGYDFHNAGIPEALNPHPWSDVNALLDLRTDSFETNTTSDYFPYAHVANWASRVRYTTQLKNYFEIVYNDGYIIGENLDTAADRTQIISAGMGFTKHYLNLVGHLDYQIINARFYAEGLDYTADFKLPGNCLILELTHQYTLGTYQTTGVSFKYNFG